MPRVTRKRHGTKPHPVVHGGAMAQDGKKSEMANGDRRLIVGISGASGVAYGIRLLEAARELGLESHLVMTKPAEMTIGYETKVKPRQVAAKATHAYAIGDIAARSEERRVGKEC